MQHTTGNNLTLKNFLLLCIFFFLIFTVYFVPTYIAIKRDLTRKWFILLINLITGWTIIGWIAVLIWACVDKKKTGLGGDPFQIIDDYYYSDIEIFAEHALEFFKQTGKIPLVREGSSTINLIDNYVKTHGLYNDSYKEVRKKTMAAVKKYESYKYDTANDVNFSERALERYKNTGELPAAPSGSLTHHKIIDYISRYEKCPPKNADYNRNN
jgi:hypothetical protein